MPNPPVRRISRADMPDDFKSHWDKGMQQTGDATLIEVLANAPDAMRHYFSDFYGQVFYNGDPKMTLDVRTKELLRIKLSKQHGCRYCNMSNTPQALAAGVSQGQLDNLKQPTAEYFNAQDLAVLEFAEQMMLQNMHGKLNQDLYHRLKNYYDDGQIVEMGYVAAILTGIAKWIFTFDMVEREEDCPIT